MRRVVITGMGITCPIGNSVEEVWESIRSAKCGIGPITRYDASNMKVKLAGEVKDLDLGRYVTPQEARKMDPFTQLAMYASGQAMESSSLLDVTEDRDRYGVFIGSGIGGLQTIEKEKERGQKRGYDNVNPYFIPMAIANMAAGSVAIKYGFKGPCTCAVTACASAGSAIGDAFRSIREGYSDVALAGGAESVITPLCLGGFTSLRALTKSTDPARASIPFDKERSGFVMGEGAAILVLEEMDHAVARGAHILGEMVGFGTNCDAYHMTAPDPEGNGAAKCMQLAMEDAHIQPSDIQYINAHGTSTKLNDSGETRAVHKAFGDAAMHLKMSSTKSMTGHLLGASAAVEAVFTTLAILHQYCPPTIGLETPGDDCDLDYQPKTGEDYAINYAMSNSFGFGGHNVSLVFKRYEE